MTSTNPTRRVLVCGGRTFVNRAFVTLVLREHLRDGDIVVHGAAAGADSLGGHVATLMGHQVEVYPANWKDLGRAAGPIRNQVMLDTGIDLVIAFPGGRGTAHMMTIARKAGVTVIDTDTCTTTAGTSA